MGGASQKPTLSLVLRQLARLIQDISVAPSTRFLDRLHRLRLRHIIVTLFNLIPLSPSLPARQWQEITARAICSLHFDVPVNSVHPPIRELKMLHFTKKKNHPLSSPRPRKRHEVIGGNQLKERADVCLRSRAVSVCK